MLWFFVLLPLLASADPCLPSTGCANVLTTNTDGDVAIAGKLDVTSVLDLGQQTTTQINAFSSPANGATVYDSTVNQVKGRVNNAWLPHFMGGFQVYADVKAQGTVGGTNTAVTWHNRTLNTALAGNLDGVYTSLANNAITFQPGTYWVHVYAIAAATNVHKSILWSTTTNAMAAEGTTAMVSTGVGAHTDSRVYALLNLTSAATYIVRTYTVANGAGTQGFGYALNLAGYLEIYTTVEITKIA